MVVSGSAFDRWMQDLGNLGSLNQPPRQCSCCTVVGRIAQCDGGQRPQDDFSIIGRNAEPQAHVGLFDPQMQCFVAGHNTAHQHISPTTGVLGQGVRRHINPEAVAKFFSDQSQTILGIVNMFSGGALSRLSIFAMGVMPYISASIIVQMLSMVYPPWEEFRKEGESGRRKLAKRALQRIAKSKALSRDVHEIVSRMLDS